MACLLTFFRQCTIILFALATCTYGNNPEQNQGEQRNLCERSFFYVGGTYVPDGVGGNIMIDQMYVEELQPCNGRNKQAPIVLIHGQAQTGTNWLNKPDGGAGWASRFLEQGHTVYIVDQTFRGRSPWGPGRGASSPTTYSAEVIQSRFTAPQPNAWPQARLHTQWPGSGVMGDPIFDTFYSSNVQFINNAMYQQTTVQAAGAALLDRIGQPTIVVGHSQGGLMPILIADARPQLVKALVLLEPTGPPFQEAVFSTGSARAWGLTDIPLQYSPPVVDPTVDLVQQIYAPPIPNSDNSTIPCILQASSPPPRRLTNLAPLPILLVTTEASYHAPYDYCTVKFLKQAGSSKTDHWNLGDLGIHGNGHMLFMERNSDEIQSLLRNWIDRL